MLSWLLPLVVTVTFYGLAAGVWKQVDMSVAQFCLLFVAVKTLANWGAWAAWSRRGLTDAESRPFLTWSLGGQVVNGAAWVFYFIALSSGPAPIVQTITAAYTAIAALLALIFLREKVVVIQLLGIALVVSAGLVLGYTSTAGPAQAEGIGWLAASIATMGLWAVAVIIFKHAYGKPGADDHRFFVMNWLGMCLTVLPYGLLSRSPQDNWSGGVVALGLVVVALYCVGDLTLFAAIARGPASIVSPVSGLYPIPTLLYSGLVLHEPISGLQYAAIAVVLVAMLMVLPAQENPILKLLQGSRGPTPAPPEPTPAPPMAPDPEPAPEPAP